MMVAAFSYTLLSSADQRVRALQDHYRSNLTSNFNLFNETLRFNRKSKNYKKLTATRASYFY